MIVHSDMVSCHSAVLKKLVDGDMAEATSRVATLVDVDPGSFARFSQWGYTGDYTAVDPEILLDSPMMSADLPNIEGKPGDPNYDDVPMVAPTELAPATAPDPTAEDFTTSFRGRNRHAPHRTPERFGWVRAAPPS